jgi:hypothetical protein
MGRISHDNADSSNSTGLNGTQREIPIFGVARAPDLADWSLVAKCEDEIAALQLCVQLSRLNYETVAFKLGIDKGHFTRIMQGHGHLPARKRTQLMALCGNLAPMQYDCLRFGFKLREDEDLDQREAELAKELALVKAKKELRIAA